ncbi:MAG: dienelactone hydrolase family protein [Maricaulaceae bacterium]
MKQFLISVSAAVLLAACGNNTQTQEQASGDIAVVEAVETAPRGTLPLPPLPDLPKPQSSLTASDSGGIYFPTKSPYDFARVLHGYSDLAEATGKGTLVLPEGASADSPVPAMVILHGSGGISEGREFEYAKLFAENGIASFVVDYYSPRGVNEDTPYVMKTMAATEIDIIADAYSALKVLGTHPAIDAKRIGVTGYSYGGMATRYVLDDRLKKIMAPDVPRFALHIDLYGPCHQTLGHGGTTGAPYLAIYGDNDNSVDPALCAQVQGQIKAGGSSVEKHLMPGAGHAWENTMPQTTFEGGFVDGCEFSFDPKSGVFLVNGEAGELPEPDMTRAERAFVRAKLGELAGTCVGYGYLVGSDPETDKKSKSIQLAFMKRVFGL